MLHRALATMILGCLLGLASSPTFAAGQTTCPAEAPRTRIKVQRFLIGAGWAAERQQFGITGTSPTLLTDAADAAACQRLRSIVGQPVNARYPQVFSYYKAGGFYFVAFDWVVPEDRIWIASSPLVVLRTDFTYVETFGM